MAIPINAADVDGIFSYPEVRRLAAACVEWAGVRRLELFLHSDMALWVDHMMTATGTDGINPTFDPRHSPLTPHDCAWLSVRDHSDRIVGCAAGRVFTTSSFIDLVRSLRLWFDPVPAEFRDGLSLVLPADVPILSGRVGHIGGMWVVPHFRGTGMSTLLARLTRGMVFDRFGADWDTSISFEKIAGMPKVMSAYGNPRTVPCVDGFFAPTGREERLFLSYSGKDATLRAVEAGVAELLGPRPAAAARKKGCPQAAGPSAA